MLQINGSNIRKRQEITEKTAITVKMEKEDLLKKLERHKRTITLLREEREKQDSEITDMVKTEESRQNDICTGQLEESFTIRGTIGERLRNALSAPDKRSSSERKLTEKVDVWLMLMIISKIRKTTSLSE